jgi:16S rRNA U516 pseudouridylate synthase RsuA-like enzyme
MFASVENHVEYLYRTQLGGLMMNEKLGIGEHLIMLHKDVENLEKSCDFLTAKENSRNFFRHIK